MGRGKDWRPDETVVPWKKEKKSDIKFMLKLAQKKGDTDLFDKYMRKMTQLCSLSESESEEEND